MSRFGRSYVCLYVSGWPPNGVGKRKATGQTHRRQRKRMDIEEFNSVIIPMRDELKGQAQRLTGDDDSAEDMVQEVMLKLWSMRETLDRYDNKKALAVTIMRNIQTDRWRHSRFESGKEIAEYDLKGEDLTAEHRDESALISRIVGHLPPLQRQIFTMKEIEGYDSKEIMRIIGCTQESLRQNLSRARRKIREDYLLLTAVRMRK